MSESEFRVQYPSPLPLPTPDHQRRITKQKWFEVAAVIALIIAGASFIAWRTYSQDHRPDPAATLAQSAKALEAAGCTLDGRTELFKRTFLTYRQQLDSFVCYADLVGESPDAPLETVIVWLMPLPGQPEPATTSLQKAVNSVGVLGQTLVASSSGALETASKTMELISDTKRPHDKGVAGTKDGWKMTYVTYRSYDEKAAPVPMLCMVLQRLSVGSDDSLSNFNHILYDAIHQGIDIKTALRSFSEHPKVQ